MVTLAQRELAELSSPRLAELSIMTVNLCRLQKVVEFLETILTRKRVKNTGSPDQSGTERIVIGQAGEKSELMLMLWKNIGAIFENVCRQKIHCSQIDGL